MRRFAVHSAILLAAACASPLAYTPNPPAKDGRLPATAVLLFDDATRDDPIRRYGNDFFLANLARKSDAGLPRLTAEIVSRLLVSDFAASGAFASIRLLARPDRDGAEKLLVQGSLEKAVYHRRRSGTELTLTVLLRAMSLPDGKSYGSSGSRTRIRAGRCWTPRRTPPGPCRGCSARPWPGSPRQSGDSRRGTFPSVARMQKDEVPDDALLA